VRSDGAGARMGTLDAWPRVDVERRLRAPPLSPASIPVSRGARLDLARKGCPLGRGRRQSRPRAAGRPAAVESAGVHHHDAFDPLLTTPSIRSRAQSSYSEARRG
jgi:hypothetical protein